MTKHIKLGLAAVAALALAAAVWAPSAFGDVAVYNYDNVGGTETELEVGDKLIGKIPADEFDTFARLTATHPTNPNATVTVDCDYSTLIGAITATGTAGDTDPVTVTVAPGDLTFGGPSDPAGCTDTVPAINANWAENEDAAVADALSNRDSTGDGTATIPGTDPTDFVIHFTAGVDCKYSTNGVDDIVLHLDQNTQQLVAPKPGTAVNLEADPGNPPGICPGDGTFAAAWDGRGELADSTPVFDLGLRP